MTVRFLYDRHSDPDLHRAAASAGDRSTLVLHGQPGTRRSAWVFTQVLDALGKVHQEHEHTRAVNDAEGFALAWLAVEGIDRMVVVDATLAGKQVRPLVLAAVAMGIDVVLVADGEVSDYFAVHVSGLADGGAEQLTSDSVRELLAASSRPSPDRGSPPSVEPGSETLGPVPRSSFLTFRADMRRVLPAVQAATADALYRTEFSVAAGHDLAEAEVAAQALHRRLVTTTDPAEQTIMLRAFQAAAFRQGTHLIADLDKTLDAVAPAAQAANLTSGDWERVNGWVRPFFPACASLLAAGVPTSRMHDLPARAVLLDGSAVSIDDAVLSVPHDAQKALRAQHFVHRWFGHGRDDPFLRDRTVTTKRRDPSDALNRLTRTHGINLRHAADDLGKEVRWWSSSWGIRTEPLEVP